MNLKIKAEELSIITDERWYHINTEHPEVINYFKEFSEILNKPTKIVDYLYENKIRYYYKYFKNRKEKPKYLLVIVKYLNGEGYIITAYFVRNIK